MAVKKKVFSLRIVSLNSTEIMGIKLGLPALLLCVLASTVSDARETNITSLQEHTENAATRSASGLSVHFTRYFQDLMDRIYSHLDPEDVSKQFALIMIVRSWTLRYDMPGYMSNVLTR